MKLLKLLRIFCLIAEIAATLGAIWAVCTVPASAWLLQSGIAKAGIHLGPRGCQLSVIARLGHGGTFAINGGNFAANGGTGAQLDTPEGTLTVDPVVAASLQRRTARKWATPVDFAPTATGLVITQPDQAVRVFRALEAPLAIGSGIAFAIWICILDWFRRLFRAVERGAAFAPNTLKLVYRIGGLLIASSLAQVGVLGWVAGVVASRLGAIAPGLSLAFSPAPAGGISGITAGVIILGLAEVFRQGVRLAEEARLTV